MDNFLSPGMPPVLLLAMVVGVVVIGSLLPLSPMEPMLVGIALYAGSSLLLPLVVVAGISEVVAKSLIYAAGTQADRVLPQKRRESMNRVRGYLTGNRLLRIAVIFVSALSGFPPFYVVTVAYGALRLPLRDYLVVGAIGRAGRHAVIITLSRGVAEAALPEFFR